MKKKLFGDYNICPSKNDVANENMILNDAVYKDLKLYLEKFVILAFMMALDV